MKLSHLLVPIALAGCSPSDEQGGNGVAGTVQSYRGDPGNYTASGFPRHVYPVQGCGTEIRLEPPFQVLEGGWGTADIAAPLALLDEPSTRVTAPEDGNAQSRVSFALPSRFRGVGMREWFAQGVGSDTARAARPLETLVSTLRSADARMGEAGVAGETRFVGTLEGNREVAILCEATDWPNPVCQAEIAIGPAGLRYLAIFPPRAADRLARVVEIGDGLFADVAAACRPTE